MVRTNRGFQAEKLTSEEIAELQELALLCRGDILKMTTLAASGHPAGSMSSIDMYLLVYTRAQVFPDDPYFPDRDRVIISHGHTSPGVYAALGRLGFFDLKKAIAGFRRAGSPFEGHVERKVPGVEWDTGNLGQGLSAGVGFALAARVKGKGYHVFTLMSDGEQAKGQVGEARRFAIKYGLDNLTVVIDYNRVQISGHIEEVMPQNIKENYLADGWKVIEVNGHDFQELYQALREAYFTRGVPVAIIAHTVIGKGVSFMEDTPEFHGKPLNLEQYRKALAELGLEDDLETYRELRKTLSFENWLKPERESVVIDVGTPREYGPEAKLDNRSAYGYALQDIGERNCDVPGKSPVVVLDCDLCGSVKTDGFAKACPSFFFQGGVQEHNTATIAGALSTQGVLTFFSDFGVFGVDETYNQHRLNDINETNLKLVCTHCGVDVGEDGKTHQCIDYLGALRNFYGFKAIVPADPNQTDRVVRYIAQVKGNFFVGVGRSRIPVILDKEGRPLFGGNYVFQYGKADWVRKGKDATIITMGHMVYRAVKAYEILLQEGLEVGVLNVSCPFDLDEEALREAKDTGVIVTYEDHNVYSGLGVLVASFLFERGWTCRFAKLGVTQYAGSGDPDSLFKLLGLSVEHLVAKVKELVALK